MTAVDPPADHPHQSPRGDSAGARRTSPEQLAWLNSELPGWVADGLISSAAAEQLRSRYHAVQRFTLARIVLTLGAAFSGVGLIWLVAANREELSPLIRFLLVAALWLGMTAASLIVAARHRTAGDNASGLVGALRALAVVSYGGVIFQAAQSLQVPAYSPRLVGVWALGTLLFAYAVRGVAPLTIGVVLAGLWVVWTVGDGGAGLPSFAVAVGASGLAATALGVAQLVSGWTEFAAPWRLIGAVFALLGLFLAALPFELGTPLPDTTAWWVLGAAGVLALAIAARVQTRFDRGELALAAGVMAGTVLLAVWRVNSANITDGSVPGILYLRSVLAVLIFLVAASGYAVLGAARGIPGITLIASFALILFITVQAFAVFSTIISGSVLFLAVGVVLLITGVLVDRGRQRLVAGADEIVEGLS